MALPVPSSAPSDIARVPMQLVHGCIVATVQVEFSDAVLRAFQQDLLERIRATRARAVILDLSGVEIMDGRDFDMVRRTLQMAGIMSAAPFIVGLRPGIAASLAEFGVDADEIFACPSLERAIAMVDRLGAGTVRTPLGAGGAE